jgi:hypothetical protein
VDANGNKLSPLQRDGGVHALFTSPAVDAPVATLPSHRLPEWQRRTICRSAFTFVFGLGLVEAISDSTIRRVAPRLRQRSFDINGHPNRNGNDGTSASSVESAKRR